MNKYVLVISFVLISLLAIGTVSAVDSSNITDDSVMPMASEDIDDELAVDEIDDDLEATSQVDELEAVDESQIDLEEVNNQSTDVLSESNADSNKPSVTVDNITFESGDTMSIPFHVADSNGNPITGGVIVSVFGVNNSLSKYVELKNGNAHVDFTISELLNVMSVNSGEDIYDIIASSVDFKNLNISQIINGFKDIFTGFSINISDVIDGLDEIENGNYINISEIRKGISFIGNGFDINFSSIKEGFSDIMDGINFNVSNFVQDVVSDIIGSDFNFTKFSDEFDGLIDDIRMEVSNLWDNITQKISFNKTAFNDAVDVFLKEFNVTRSEILSKSDAFMSYLNFTAELKNNITNILEGNNLNLTYIVNAVKGVIASNLTISNIINALSNVSDGADFNVSDLIHKIADLNVSSIASSFGKIFDSLTIDFYAIIDTFRNYDFNVSKYIDKLVNITGINVTKISNIFDGVKEIFTAFTFDKSNITLGIKSIFSGFILNMSNVSEIIDGININDNFTAALGEIIDEFNVTIGDKVNVFARLLTYLDLSFTEELENEFTDVTTDVLIGKGLNITKAIPVFKDVLDYNNLTFFDVLVGLNNVTDGLLFNISKIIDKISDSNFNGSQFVSSLHKLFDSISLDYGKVFTGLFNMISSIDFNMSSIFDGLEEIFDGIHVNVSAIKEGFNKMGQEIDINASKIISALINNIEKSLSFNTSSIIQGLTKIVDSVSLNISSVIDGISTIVDSFKLNISSIFSGADKIIHSLGFNVSNFMNGITEIVNGMGVNVSNILSQLASKFGRGAIMSYIIIPEAYIYSFTFKYPTQVYASKVTVSYGKSKKMVVSLKDVFGKPVAGKKITVKLNGKTYTGVTNSKGKVSIKIPKNLAAKTYKARLSFAGDDVYAKSTGSAKVVVSKLTPKITAKKKTFRSSVKTKKYTVVLKTNKNKAMKKKKVTLKVNGKTYKAKTNGKGKAIFKITKLTKIGTFKAVVKYNGDTIYKKVTKKVNIKIM